MVEEMLNLLKGKLVTVYPSDEENGYVDYLFHLTTGWTVYNTSFQSKDVYRIIFTEYENPVIYLK